MKALKQRVKSAPGYVVAPAALVIACMIVAEVFKQPIAKLDSFLGERQPAIQHFMIGMTIVGSVILVSAFIFLLVRGESMTGAQVQEQLNSQYQGRLALSTWRKSGYRFRGKSAGRAFEIEVSFRQIKELVRTGLWLRAAIWRSFFAAMIGVFLICIGTASLLIVHAPPWLKLMSAAVSIYALTRITVGFCRA